MFDTNPVPLAKLLDDAGSGKIQLPDFQRGWVWSDDLIKGLLASVSRRFPIGVILTLETGGEIRLRSRLIEGVSDSTADKADAFLLDGQQRLTSLYQSLKHEGPVTTQDSKGQSVKRWYYIDMLAAMNPETDRDEAIISVSVDRVATSNFGRVIVRDLSTRELEYQHHMMPTELLLTRGAAWERGYIDHWREPGTHPAGDAGEFLDGFLESVKDAFEKYQVPVITLDKETPKEAVCQVFQKVNQGGIPLGTFELVTASFAADAEDFSLRDDWRDRKSRLNRYAALQDISGDQFLQVVSLLVTQENRRKADAGEDVPMRPISCKKEAMLGLSLERDYKQWADKVVTGFESAARFLSDQFVFTAKDVPYNAQLAPLAALYADLGDELQDAAAKAKLERWFWSVIFAEDYSSAVETKSADDLRDVAGWVRGGEVPVRLNEASIEPARLLRLRSRPSAAYKGLYALLMKNATDWRDRSPMSLDVFKNSGIDIHHIFPRRWCQQKDIPKDLYNSIVNKTPIDAGTNKKIGGKAPSEYLLQLRQNMAASDLDAVLQSHLVNPDALSSDDFAEYFVGRGEALLKLIGEAIGKGLPNGRETFREALNSAGLPTQPDDEEDEYDPIGGEAYDEDFADVAD